MFPSPPGRFTVLGSLGVQGETLGSSGPSVACSLGSPVETQYSGLQETLQSTVNSQGSCFPVLVSVAVYVRAVGKAPPPFPLRNEKSGIPERGELLSAFLLLLSFLSKVQSAASVPCFGFLRLATTELPSSPASWFPAPARGPLLLL